ncbi:alpha/beta hydrolase [Tessaracoccus sp. Z1128]
MLRSLFPRPTATPVWPEARPLHLGGGDVGVVMIHGFTGSVQAIAGWAEALATSDGDWAGARVVAPRLPGHGTSWQDLARTRWWDWYGAVEDAYLELAGQHKTVFVAGLSMGGALALHLAAQYSVAGVVLVNPSIATTDRRAPVVTRLPGLLPSFPGISSDIAKPGVVELAYPRFSARSAATMAGLWREVQEGLRRIDAPVLLMKSAVDHVVEPLGSEIIRRDVRDVRLASLDRSYHVATLDYDADLIVAESRRFITSLR